jgi:SAM-dependent methyltransferase
MWPPARAGAAAGSRCVTAIVVHPEMSEDNFNRIADEYDESLPAHVVDHYLAKRAAFVAAECPRPEYQRVLDVGCGTGMLAARLTEDGFEVTGLDPSQGMLDVMQGDHPSVEAVRGTGDELPFEDGAFDVAITVAALHHIAEPGAVRATLGEMVRVTRPGGRIIIWDHNPRNPYWKRLMARVPQDDGSERLIPEREVLSGLLSGGARPIRSDQLGFVPDFVPAPLIGVARRAERVAERTPGLRSLCAHNVVVATKP